MHSEDFRKNSKYINENCPNIHLSANSVRYGLYGDSFILLQLLFWTITTVFFQRVFAGGRRTDFWAINRRFEWIFQIPFATSRKKFDDTIRKQLPAIWLIAETQMFGYGREHISFITCKHDGAT